MDRQTVPAESLGHDLHDTLGVMVAVESDNEVIGVANQKGTPL
jgi:hypothetical protein